MNVNGHCIKVSAQQHEGAVLFMELLLRKGGEDRDKEGDRD